MREKTQVTWPKKSETPKREINAYEFASSKDSTSDNFGATVAVFGRRRGSSICKDGGGGPWAGAREKLGHRGGGGSVCVRTDFLSGAFVTLVSMSWKWCKKGRSFRL